MSNIYKDEKYLYAENLKGKRVKMTITKIVEGVDFKSERGTEKGYDVHFKGTDKVLGITGKGVKRQLSTSTGTEETEEMIGKEITVYPVKSAKSASGQAIRILINR